MNKTLHKGLYHNKKLPTTKIMNVHNFDTQSSNNAFFAALESSFICQQEQIAADQSNKRNYAQRSKWQFWCPYRIAFQVSSILTVNPEPQLK